MVGVNTFEVFGEEVEVDRGRHEDQTEVVSFQDDVSDEAEEQIGLEMALVHLV